VCTNCSAECFSTSLLLLGGSLKRRFVGLYREGTFFYREHTLQRMCRLGGQAPVGGSACLSHCAPICVHISGAANRSNALLPRQSVYMCTYVHMYIYIYIYIYVPICVLSACVPICVLSVCVPISVGQLAYRKAEEHQNNNNLVGMCVRRRRRRSITGPQKGLNPIYLKCVS